MIRRFLALVLTSALLCGGARAENASVTTGLPGDTAGLPGLVRLQVVAESDSPEAQALKLALRDTCLRAAEVCLSDAPDADAAYARLTNHLDDFQSAVESRARALGYAGLIHCETGTFDFPDRIYGRLLVPAGRYRALRVTIGAGRGHNWWCVLYPSLCLLNEADAAGALDIKAALDWLRRRLFGGDAA